MTARQQSKMDPPRKLAVEIARIAHGDNAEDILVLDLRGISPVADYFVICTGTSSRQMRSVADEVAQYGKETGQPAWHVAGNGPGSGGCLECLLDRFGPAGLPIHIISRKAYL